MPSGRPTVVLRHALTDGNSHFDWLLDLALDGDPADRQHGADAGLATFRCAVRPDQLRPGETMTAQRLADHRRAYLSYEGPVSGGRGTVTRIASGEVRLAGVDDARIEIVATWHGSGPTTIMVLERPTRPDDPWWLIRLRG